MPNDRAGSRGSPDIRFVFSVMRTRPEVSLSWFLFASDILKLASGRFIVHTSALPRQLCDRIAATKLQVARVPIAKPVSFFCGIRASRRRKVKPERKGGPVRPPLVRDIFIG
jgi:hypothetical protein